MCLKTMADENWISNFGCDLNGGIFVVGVWWTYKFEVLCVGNENLFFTRGNVWRQTKKEHMLCAFARFRGGREKGVVPPGNNETNGDELQEFLKLLEICWWISDVSCDQQR